MESLYRQHIIDLYKHPLNFGNIDRPEIVIDERNTTCGDVIHLEMKCDAKGNISEIGFQGDGCAISRASASLLTEKMKGHEISESKNITLKDIEQWLNIPISAARINCALLSLQAMRRAEREFSKKT